MVKCSTFYYTLLSDSLSRSDPGTVYNGYTGVMLISLYFLMTNVKALKIGIIESRSSSISRKDLPLLFWLSFVVFSVAFMVLFFGVLLNYFKFGK